MRKKGGRGGSKTSRSNKGTLLKSYKDFVRHISFDYESRKANFPHEEKYKLPAGIKVLVAYLSVLLFFHLSYFFIGLSQVPVTILFGQFVRGQLAFLIVSLLTVGLIFMIYGLVKRRRWSFYLSLVWFIFGIINAVVSLVFSNFEVADVTKNLMILSAVSVLVINLLIIWYLFSEKNFFFAHRFVQKVPKAADKIFIAVIILFLACVLAVAGFIGYDFYRSNLRMADSAISQLNGKSDSDQSAVCSSQPSQQEKDICFMVAAVKQGSLEMCSQISSEFYRMTCERA